MSESMPASSMVTASTAAGDHDFASACSISSARKAPFEPAPVTPTRMAPSFMRATNTPAMA